MSFQLQLYFRQSIISVHRAIAEIRLDLKDLSGIRITRHNSQKNIFVIFFVRLRLL